MTQLQGITRWTVSMLAAKRFACMSPIGLRGLRHLFFRGSVPCKRLARCLLVVLDLRGLRQRRIAHVLERLQTLRSFKTFSSRSGTQKHIETRQHTHTKRTHTHN